MGVVVSNRSESQRAHPIVFLTIPCFYLLFTRLEGRAYLFDYCVNVTIGPPEDRQLMTGAHSVCDIFCKRCNLMIGWTYAKAYESSQKYKEGKFIVEKINLHLEESDYYNIPPPAGERRNPFRARSISWGSDYERGSSDTIYEYRPGSPAASMASSRRNSGVASASK
jgi:Yippee zinc-binding/DNA-binding /Mis18, centromere assembly